MDNQIGFILAALGNAVGEIRAEGTEDQTFRLRPGKEQSYTLEGDFDSVRKLTFSSSRGKLADSEDSMLFFGFKIDPSAENFTISGDFCLEKTTENTGWLSGFGAFAIDTLSSARKGCRHRNMLSAGAHRSVRINEYSRGIRIVSGYADTDAFEGGSLRKLDASNEFGVPYSHELGRGEKFRITLSKTDSGFTAQITADSGTDVLSFPGCDFLMKQEEDAVYAGFGAAGNITVTVSDIHMETCPGVVSNTPVDALKNIVPDYPFDRKLIDMEQFEWHPSMDSIYVSPSGKAQNPGTEEEPLDLATALLSIRNGGRIILEDGVYSPVTSYIAPSRDTGSDRRKVLVCARNNGGAILDGSHLVDDLPVMIVAGDLWHIRGLSFRKGRGPGLFICGSVNKIERCEAFENKDTGFLICSYPGSDKSRWPYDNLILSCVSHHNCDPSGSNADGFGAKLSIGEGNRFVKCSAYNNIDDGFDFYSKSTLGPIGSVTAENCIAYRNGYISGEKSEAGSKRGIGFKLGGENQPVCHVAKNCIAYENALAGFSTNSNPSAQMFDLLSWNNGEDPAKNNYRLLTDVDTEWVHKNLWTDKTWGEARPVLMFIVPRTSGGGAEKVITSLASQMVDKYKVYIVTTVKEDGVKGYEFSGEIEDINIYKRFKDNADALEERLAQLAQPAPQPARKPSLFERLFGRSGASESAPAAEAGPVVIDPEEEKFKFQIDCVRRLKREFCVDCAISFLNSANYINAMSRVNERCIISIRSCLSGPFAPSDCRSEAGRARITDACAGADVIVPVSLEAGVDLAGSYGADAGKMRTIYNSIDPDHVREKCREDFNGELRRKMSDSEFTFISLGRLTEKKGQWHIIRAFRSVVDKHPGALLVIPGREGKKNENVTDYLRTLISDNGLEDNVILPGFFDNPYSLLAKSDAYVMASFNEGFPNALVEAMAAGLPVIACDCSSGPREILAPDTDYMQKSTSLNMEKYGIIVPECSGHKLDMEPLEPEEQMLADAMTLLIEDKDICEKYAAKGLKRVRDFAKSDILSQWEEIIENDD